jgi:hypothetical protein
VKQIVYSAHIHNIHHFKQNQGSFCICHSWWSWSCVAGNGIPLRCLQSYQWNPHRTFVKHVEKNTSSFV